MMKGYLTVFLTLSLSILSGFVLFLTAAAIQNGEKVRFECAVDTGMNAVLSEYHIGLLERYGLLYVDTSYLGESPSILNLKNRFHFYIWQNTSEILNKENAPWGRIMLEDVEVLSYETAVAGMGASMRNQAVLYAQDSGIVREESTVVNYKEEFLRLDALNSLEEWSSVMEQIAGMELPTILNEKGEWEEVPLSNPADWVYGLVGSDIVYLARADINAISPVSVDLESCLSHRELQNTAEGERIYNRDEEIFLSYLFEEMGSLMEQREGSLLSCQIEYLSEGRSSDLENISSVAERLFNWRFVDNTELALSDGGLYEQAVAAANELYAVQLKNEFEEPVAKSILYACAFLETVGDMREIYSSGSIPLRKSKHQMSVTHVLGGNFYSIVGEGGLSYGQYLACMLLLLSEENLNLRAMDIMEMDIRFRGGEYGFQMDGCVERYEAQVIAKGNAVLPYQIRRKYGYY